jgi:tripartite ATP-independent transporter DctM subunit
MTLGLLILLVVFTTLLVIQTPIAFVIGVATIAGAWALGYENVVITIGRDLAGGLDNFALLAIPFFILAGELMGAGGLARRLIDFAAAIAGRFRGGLPLVNTLTCMFFGAISGSATAAVSSIGSTMIPEMNRKGYPKDFNIAVTVSSATTGLLIPPSNVMIVYAVVASNVSIGALFLAGILPGVLMGVLIMAACLVLTRNRPNGATTSAAPPLISSTARALPSLMLVFFVLGGILGGIFTATEASAVAVLWAFLLGAVFYREIPLKMLPRLVLNAGRTTGIVMLLIATSLAMSRLLTTEQIPMEVSSALLGLSRDPTVIMLTIVLILLLVGTFMDMTPAILVFTPIFLPVAAGLGVHPVHFGVLMIANLCIGLCTPPVGSCLFLGCTVGGSNIMSVSRAMLPFYAVMIAGMLVIVYVPSISMWLPRLLGMVR